MGEKFSVFGDACGRVDWKKKKKKKKRASQSASDEGCWCLFRLSKRALVGGKFGCKAK